MTAFKEWRSTVSIMLLSAAKGGAATILVHKQPIFTVLKILCRHQDWIMPETREKSLSKDSYDIRRRQCCTLSTSQARQNPVGCFASCFVLGTPVDINRALMIGYVHMKGNSCSLCGGGLDSQAMGSVNNADVCVAVSTTTALDSRRSGDCRS